MSDQRSNANDSWLLYFKVWVVIFILAVDNVARSWLCWAITIREIFLSVCVVITDLCVVDVARSWRFWATTIVSARLFSPSAS